MLRNVLLPALAIAALAGCATDYAYRGGNGDYYYGQPQTEYRYYDPYGAATYGSYGARYFYDRYGRLVYGDPYAYYGSPYGYGAYGAYGGNWRYRPRPQQGGQHDGQHEHGDRDHDHDDGHDGHDGGMDRDGNHRRPPWRDIGRMIPRAAPGDDTETSAPRVRQQQAPTPFAAPAAPQRSAPIAPRSRSDGERGGSLMGRVIRNAKAPDPANDE